MSCHLLLHNTKTKINNNIIIIIIIIIIITSFKNNAVLEITFLYSQDMC